MLVAAHHRAENGQHVKNYCQKTKNCDHQPDRPQYTRDSDSRHTEGLPTDTLEVFQRQLFPNVKASEHVNAQYEEQSENEEGRT